MSIEREGKIFNSVREMMDYHRSKLTTWDKITLNTYWPVHRFIRDKFFYYFSPRCWKFFLQRRWKGFDDQCAWNLDYNISEFILPRLKDYREQMYGCPGYHSGEYGEPDKEAKEMTMEEWEVIVDDIIYYFEVDTKRWEISGGQDDFYWEPNHNKYHPEGVPGQEENIIRYRKGWKYFCCYYHALWS